MEGTDAQAVEDHSRGRSGVESISVFDIFKIGVGPSSSHTMGPWRAAQQFLAIACEGLGDLDRIASVRVDLFGSLAKTGRGHGTDIAVLMGLTGEDPVTCDPAAIHPKVAAIRKSDAGSCWAVRARSRSTPKSDLDLPPRPRSLPFHPNGLRFTATIRGRFDRHDETFYSVGGGFVVREGDPDGGGKAAPNLPMPIEIPGRPRPPLPELTAI